MNRFQLFQDESFNGNGHKMKYIPINPPGTAYCKSFCSAKRDRILDRIGLQDNCPSSSLLTIPGRTSISCPTWKERKKKKICYNKICGLHLSDWIYWLYFQNNHYSFIHYIMVKSQDQCFLVHVTTGSGFDILRTRYGALR